MKRSEKSFYRKLYIVIGLCIAILVCIGYLGVTGGMEKVSRRMSGQQTAGVATEEPAAGDTADAAGTASPAATSPAASATPSAEASETPAVISDDSLLRAVNREHPLSESYVPSDLVSVNVASLRNETLRSEAAAALENMFAAAEADGISLVLVSGYRSYSYEQGLYDYYSNLYGQDYADTIDDQPGLSEHQLGLAVDIDDCGDESCTLDQCFQDTAAYAWLQEHAAEYGFIERYPEGREDVTGIIYSPWAYRYVGVENAQKINASGLTLDEYTEGMQ
jgi:D-alanyl-D-alanine carboxypeptidase